MSLTLLASVSVGPGCVSRLIVEGESASGGDAGEVDDDERDSYGESDGDPCQAVPCDGLTQCCADGSGCVGGGCEEACSNQVLCGADDEQCCDSLEVCIEGACDAPDTPCGDGFDCPEGEICDPILGVCIPSDGGACVAPGSFDEIRMKLEWSAEELDVLSVPLVANLDDDPQAEIVVVSARSDELGGSFPPHTENGDLWVFDGDTGEVQLHIDADEGTPVHPDAAPVDTPLGIAAPGIADVDGDGVLDIVYGARRINDTDYSWVRAVSLTGDQLWRTSSLELAIRRSCPSMADFEGDGRAEAVFGGAIVADGGQIAAVAPFAGREADAPLHGSNEAGDTNIPRGNGGLSAVVDLDGDGDPEVVTGRRAWDYRNGSLVELWDAGGSDGWPAVADLDGDGRPEVALVSSGTLRFLDGATGRPWCSTFPNCSGVGALTIPGGGRGGPPSVADFDGDGAPEVAVAAGSAVLIAEPVAAPEGIRVLWTSPIQDQTSSGTGLSAFDFQGDGAAELLFGDECAVRGYDGATGRVVFEVPNTQSTSREYPVVADVDADGRAEIIMVANTFASANCGATPRRGVFVYGADGQSWSPARKVWTSHAQRPTTSDGFGHTPRQLSEAWTDPLRNTMRATSFGPGTTAAPDLELEVVTRCDGAKVEVVTQVRNAGAVTANMNGVVLELVDGSGTIVDSEEMNGLLVPGEVGTVNLEAASPANGFVVRIASTPSFEECDVTDNELSVPPRSCP